MGDYNFYFMEYHAGRMPKWKPLMYFLFDKLTSLFIHKDSTEIKNPKKILIIRNDHIGDVILSTPVFREVRKAYPNAEITALVSNTTKPLIEKNKNIDKIITFGVFSEMPRRTLLREYIKVFKKIKSEKYDIGIDLRSSSTNIIFLLWLPRVKMRIGYYNITGGKIFLTKPILLKEFKHAIKIFLDVVKEGLDFKTENCLPEIVTDEEDEKLVNNYLRINKLKKFICVAPAATQVWKTWPSEKFEELIRRFSRAYPSYKILLTGGKKDSDLIKKLSVTKNCTPLIDFNLRQQSLVFKKSKLVISNDGGLMNMAWVSGAKLIALFGPLAALQSVRPWKNAVVIIDKSYDITNIKVSRVEREIKKILDKHQIKKSSL